MFNYKMNNRTFVLCLGTTWKISILRQKIKYIEGFCTPILGEMTVPVVAVCVVQK